MRHELIMALNFLESAKSAKEKWRFDDGYVRASCFHLFNGIEYCLKFVRDASGMPELRSHSIKALCADVRCQIGNYTWFNSLYKIADQISPWYTGTRYIKDYSADVHMADKVILLLEHMLRDLDTFAPKDITEIGGRERVQTTLDRNETGLSVDDIEYLLPTNFLENAVNMSAKALNSNVMYAVHVYYDTKNRTE